MRRIVTTILSLFFFMTGAAASEERPEKPPSAGSVHTIADMCTEHGVPEAFCTKCNPALIPVFQAKGDWCAAHGLPESVCPLCNSTGHSSSMAPAADWCGGHGVPESKCTKCNPGLIAKFKAAGDWCEEHGFPESICPICNPAPRPAGVPAPSAIAPGTRIRFRSAEIERAAGIAAVPVREVALDVGVECTARLDFDRNAMADIRAPIPGVVKEVLVDLGDRVEAGAELFVLESFRVGDMQGQLRAARQRAEVAGKNAMRERRLHESQVSSTRDVELASQELEEAEAELGSLESALQIAGASATGHSGRCTLRAPKSGTVVRRPATVGTFASEDVSLATVADTSTIWAFLEIRETDAASVQLGQHVTIEVDGLLGRTFSGEITWIAAEVDPRTRTVTARAEVPNPNGVLRANQFARASISVAAPENQVAVPRESIQRLGEQTVVFLRTGDGLYEPIQVEIGRANGSLVQVIGSIRPGSSVVTDGAFLLKTELSKENIGAGCCEVEPPGGD
jgi:cobalt-zinc-cadmium efflux system membrane fusion protein